MRIGFLLVAEICSWCFSVDNKLQGYSFGSINWVNLQMLCTAVGLISSF